MGHPNEGKSSVVSTLSEDDTVRVSPYPGETVVCKTYPVIIDGVEVIRFTDTPGFQSPRKTLAWFSEYTGPQESIVKAFIEANKGCETFKDECELFKPLAAGAGIIYVADASRPLRNVDMWEMEILRLTGLPRMAIINSKSHDHDFTGEWKNEFRKHFNAIRIFNAHNATYSERIDLLSALKHMDQEWQRALDWVISAFKKEWDHRNVVTAEIILNFLIRVMSHQVSETYKEESQKHPVKEKLEARYLKEINAIENKAHLEIRKLFKHNIFNLSLPGESILKENISDKSTWKLLGLNKRQLVGAAAAIGGSAGAAIDLAVAGHSFGLFAALGGAIFGGSAFFGTTRLADTKIVGMKLAGYEMRVGPAKNIQVAYVFLDRALIFYSHIINWAHGRRDYPGSGSERGDVPFKGNKIGYASRMEKDEIKGLNLLFDTLKKKDYDRIEQLKSEGVRIIKKCLEAMLTESAGSENQKP